MGSDITEALRNEVARRADHRCEYCLIREGDIAFRLQVDHVISRKHGGLWADHFQLDGSSIRAISQVGCATSELLKFSLPERLAERGLLQSLGSYPTKA